jgi:GntR family transcriptional regulator/MocR family aminotransferase
MYGIHFRNDSPLSRYQQLVNQLREKITRGELAGGTRLVSSRELARTLSISRAIVIEVYEQLKLEGYLESRQGSGTYVRGNLIWTGSGTETSIRSSNARSDTSAPGNTVSFVPGLPECSLFPRRKWLACYRKAVEYADRDDLAYAPPGGRKDLREALSSALYRLKGLRSEPDRIFITSGSSQALAMLARCFDPARIVMEDPHAEFVYRIFEGLGCRVTFAPVDDQGIMEQRIPDEPQDLVYVTPSHQFPLGGTLSAERRVALLRKARSADAWIIEDDFDSEFRYIGHPVTPLQVMAPERVVYVGSFSKLVSPALRLGFMVLPPGLVDAMSRLAGRRDLWLEGLQQKAMAVFIEEGHFERHVAHAHRVYREKGLFLKRLVLERLGPEWRVSGDSTGMHLVLGFYDSEGTPRDVARVVLRLRRQGLIVNGASSYYRGRPANGHRLLVAFGRRSEQELTRLVDAIADITKSLP